MDRKQVRKLLEKYLSGQTTSEENAVVESWYAERSKALTDQLVEIDYDIVGKEIWTKIESGKIPQHKTIRLWYKLASAAAILTVFAIPFLLEQKNPVGRPKVTEVAYHDISPGRDKAILTLASGVKISLDGKNDGQVVREGSTTIVSKNGKIAYTAAEDPIPSMAFNMLETPKGGQHQLTLPDGTLVWLNAATRIKFPVSFASEKTREVELIGEAYFEVAKDARHPFLVKTGGQHIEVLGTHFNIQAYPDDREETATLMEGSVKVSSTRFQATKFLSPGEETILSKQTSTLTKNKADIENTMAWKNGYFIFNNEDFESIMKKVSRWYDVEISYQQKIFNFRLGGRVSRSKNLSSVLHALELTGQVHFKVKERRILVSK